MNMQCILPQSHTEPVNVDSHINTHLKPPAGLEIDEDDDLSLRQKCFIPLIETNGLGAEHQAGQGHLKTKGLSFLQYLFKKIISHSHWHSKIIFI